MDALSIAIAIIGCVISVSAFFVGRQSTSKAEGREAGSITKDIEYIKKSVERIEGNLTSGISRLEGRIDEQAGQITKIAQEATRAHECAKSAHKRLDELKITKGD